MSLSEPTQLIVALDFPKPNAALEFVDEMKGLPLVFKVGLELFMSGGPDLVRELVHRKQRVFLDLKMYDIPNQVAKAAQQLAFLHVEMMTLHIAGGSVMVKQVAKELSEIPNLRPKILGVTVLTSFDDTHWAEVTKSLTGHPARPGDSVSGMIAAASDWGLDGVVCSAKELSYVRKNFPSLYTVVPGIRPQGSDQNDQARVVTPAEAHQLGAHAVVVGRPITASSQPRKSAEAILKDLC
ncbi:MAG: orotidine-5'-phosphate decarboxylase [Bdellovibrio sp.]|nr:orotidine-5'-phosphate decarboxylase [Bdellovibrio sp.]